MLSASSPLSSARATPARSTRSRLRGMRGARARVVRGVICVLLSSALTTLRRKRITYDVSNQRNRSLVMQSKQVDNLTEPAAVTAGGRTMKSIVQDRYGPAPEDVLRLAEIDKPMIRRDEVLVRVHAASVDRGTWHIMAGLPYPIRIAGFGLRRPKYANPGRNLAGTVEAVGAEVTGFAPGDEVFGTATSTFAEYAAARPGKLARTPANLSVEEAAAVPVSGITA